MSIPTHDDQEQAKQTLAYIRQTMESSSTFTAVSGWGLVAVGVLGLAASWYATSRGEPAALSVWLPTAVISVLLSMVFNAWKAKRLAVPLWSGSLRKVAWVMAPALVAGAMLTWALGLRGDHQLLPGVWLSLYGAGVTAGGTFSVRAIRWMGMLDLALGALVLMIPERSALLLALGFGALHIAFGFYLVERHGG